MANIRNQCSWVHSDDQESATRKAKELVRMAVAKVIKHTPQSTIDVPVDKTALIVGGGATGMTAALTLADQGFPVHLVEKEPQLGGHLKHLFISLNGKEPQKILNDFIKEVFNHPRITVHLESKVTQTAGFKGNFSSQIDQDGKDPISITHGVTILATGGEEYQGPDYCYGTDPRIITQGTFEGYLAEWAENPPRSSVKSLVMVQCVGPAEEYCSRICCTSALKNALAFKDLYPESNVTIVYKDIRVYGFNERLYSDVRRRGVVFLRYDEDQKPEVLLNQEKPSSGKKSDQPDIMVKVWDQPLQRQVELHPDLVVLSMPVIPQPNIKDLANLFKVSIDNDGFFLEAHIKLRPVDFSTEGIFMAGTAHYPKLLNESIIQAQAAASRAGAILSKDYLEAGGVIAVVDQGKCTGCLTCVRVCPFEVPLIQAEAPGVGEITGAAYIEPATCQGCGICVAECPAKAIDLMQYTTAQLEAKIKSLFHPQDRLLQMAS
jgi:heterodisulfide reductase subunit A-like polyferredoxin